MIKKTFIMVFFAMLAMSIVNCSTVEKVGKTFKESPIVYSMAITQIVTRIIEKSPIKDARAQRIVNITDSIEGHLDGDPSATVDTIMAVANDKINWGGMSRGDQLLVKDIFSLVQARLMKERELKKLSPEAVISIKEILGAVRSASSYYIE